MVDRSGVARRRRAYGVVECGLRSGGVKHGQVPCPCQQRKSIRAAAVVPLWLALLMAAASVAACGGKKYSETDKSVAVTALNSDVLKYGRGSIGLDEYCHRLAEDARQYGRAVPGYTRHLIDQALYDYGLADSSCGHKLRDARP